MYIENQASKNKVTYISNKVPDDYFNTTQLEALLDEFVYKKGSQEVIEYLKSKIKELK